MTFVPISSEHASLSNALTEAYTLSGALVSCRLVRLPDIPTIGERIIHEGDTYRLHRTSRLRLCSKPGMSGAPPGARRPCTIRLQPGASVVRLSLNFSPHRIVDKHQDEIQHTMKRTAVILPLCCTLLVAPFLGGCVAAIGNRNPGVTVGQQLIDLQKAKDAGAITEAEFQAQKAKLLGTK